MNFMTKKMTFWAVALAFLLVFSPATKASFLETTFTSGVLNAYEDQSREAFIDVDNSGTVSVGDVLIGFIRIDNQQTPTLTDFDNQIYVIFSQQLIATDGVFQIFGPTTVEGLRLSDIVDGAPENAIAGIYSSQDPILDLIVNAPGATLQDYFNVITTNMTLDLIAGFGTTDDFFVAISILAATADDDENTGILQLQTGETVAFFTGGLSILVNNTVFSFAELAASTNPLAGVPTLHQLAISGGNVVGGSDDPNFTSWANAAGFGGGPHEQCNFAATPEVNSPCGFIDNANFALWPVRQVPEPASLALLGIGLLGLVAIRRRLSRR